ncbi:hypothetical protein RvY_14650, partial [Ramazzottius varieornatus]
LTTYTGSLVCKFAEPPSPTTLCENSPKLLHCSKLTESKLCFIYRWVLHLASWPTHPTFLMDSFTAIVLSSRGGSTWPF